MTTANNKIGIKLGETQETLLITLWARASEQLQPEPIVIDRKSTEIYQQIDYDFTKFNKAKSTQVGSCLRGRILDRWVQDYLQEYPHGTVIEIGAGLNTRFERVDNGSVHWFDLDLPDTMALREQFFTESDRRKFITASALDTDWIDRVQAVATTPCMFVAEGVLMYLEESQVKQLLANLAQNFPGCRFAFGAMSPLLLKLPHEAVKHTSASFKWGIRNIQAMENWGDNYKIIDLCRFGDLPKRIEAKYYRRYSLFSRLLFSLPILNNSYRLVLMNLG